MGKFWGHGMSIQQWNKQTTATCEDRDAPDRYRAKGTSHTERAQNYFICASLKPGKSSLVRDSWRVTLWKRTINKELGYHAGSGFQKVLFTRFVEYVKLLHLASVFFCICDMLWLRIEFLGLGDGPVDKSVGYGGLKT